MMIKHLHKFLCLLAILVFTACQTTNQSTPGGQTPAEPTFGDFVLKMTGTNVGTTRSPSAILDGEVQVSNVRLAIEEINFYAEGVTEDVEIDYEGPFVSFLVNDNAYSEQVVPSIPAVQLDFVDYAEIHLKFAKVDADELDSELVEDPLAAAFLQDQSLVIEGSFMEGAGQDLDGNSGQNLVNFRLISDLDIEVTIVTTTPFSISSAIINYFFIVLRVDVWFENTLELFQVLSSAAYQDGYVMIEDESDLEAVQDILDVFEENIDNSFRMASSEDEDFDEEDEDDTSSSD